MKTLYITEDVYNALNRRRGGLSLSDTLRKVLGVPKRRYRKTRNKSEAVTKGIARAQRRGIHCGRPAYSLIVREKARKLKRSGLTLGQIALFCGISRSTVRRICDGMES